MLHVGRNHSLVVRTSECGWAIKLRRVEIDTDLSYVTYPRSSMDSKSWEWAPTYRLMYILLTCVYYSVFKAEVGFHFCFLYIPHMLLVPRPFVFLEL